LEHIDQEIERARRTMAPLVVAYVEVVGLKAVNDSQGHAAGDALLQRAVDGIRGYLRSYDLIVRIGGDEFLCVMSGATIKDAEHRFNVIQTALAADSDPCEIKVGFAALEAEDSAAELIRRADAELPVSPDAKARSRQRRELTHGRWEVALLRCRGSRWWPIQSDALVCGRGHFFVGPALAAAERRSTDQHRALLRMTGATVARNVSGQASFALVADESSITNKGKASATCAYVQRSMDLAELAGALCAPPATSTAILRSLR
jgi:diguanylate cyclase (GGDEF)-like protein